MKISSKDPGESVGRAMSNTPPRLMSAAELRRTTAPALLLAARAVAAKEGRLSRQEARHLPRGDVGGLRPHGRPHRQGLCRARPAGGRARRHHGGRLRGVADLRPRRPVARRHRLWHLPHGLGGGGRVPDARRRRRPVHRRGPGVRRPHSPARRRPAALAQHRGDRRHGAVRLQPRQAHLLCRARQGRRRRRSRLARGARGPSEAGAAGLHRLHLRHDRPSQGCARHPRQASGGDPLGCRALSDTGREGAPHGRLPAAVPRARPRYRGDLAAADAAGSPHRRERRGPAGDAVRDGADRAVHRAALSAEAGRTGSRAGGPDVSPQALRLRAGHGVRARSRQAPLGERGNRVVRASRTPRGAPPCSSAC